MRKLAPTVERDDYFLCPTNPIATKEQEDLERLSMSLMTHPEILNGRRQVEFRWRTLMQDQPPAEAWREFDSFIDEHVFNYILHAVNSDPNYPKMLRMFFMQHRWFGMDVLGSRAGGGGPSSTYTVIPMEHRANYRITGQMLENPSADITFTLSGNISLAMTLATLYGSDLVTDENGRFEITIGPDKKPGAVNHIVSTIGAMYLFIRESPSDWKQMPMAMRVERLDPPTAPPMSVEDIAIRSRDFMVDDVAMMHWFRSFFAYRPVNEISKPIGSGSIGGLISQMSSFGNLRLGEDDALVITFTSGAAVYRDVTLNSYWNIPFDFRDNTASLNNAQSVPNADGSTTYVISRKDPGVHNWLDPVGRSEFILINRWQGLPADFGGGPAPSAVTIATKIDKLDEVLPPGMKRVTPAERAQQIKQRQADFDLRFKDGSA